MVLRCYQWIVIACLLLPMFSALNAAAQNTPAAASTSAASSAAPFPPAPAQYFNDYAGITSERTRASLNDELADFDKQTKTQVVVAIFKHKASAAPLDDYCADLFDKWGIGRKDNDSGVVLFVFVDDRLITISTGKGMESVLPGVECQKIVENLMVPKFRKRKYDVAFSSAVDGILDAILIKKPRS